MVPAEFMSLTVTMPTDALAQFLDFFNELLSRQMFEVRVHDAGPHIVKDRSMGQPDDDLAELKLPGENDCWNLGRGEAPADL